MLENCNEIKINNDEIYIIMKQIIKLAYVVIENYKRTELELISLTEKAEEISANV